MDTINDTTTIEKVVNYLVHGKIFLELFSLDEDITTREFVTIGRACFLTDGTWVWPSYYSYYLKKHSNMYINESFLEYLNNRNFEKINPLNVNVQEANDFLTEYLDIRTYRSE